MSASLTTARDSQFRRAEAIASDPRDWPRGQRLAARLLVLAQPDDDEQATALHALLAANPLFSTVPREALRDLAAACELVHIPAGTRVLGAGEPVDALLGVLQGGLRAIRPSNSGPEDTIDELYRGDTFGTMGLLADRAFPVDLYAVRDSTLARLPRVKFLALAEQHPQLLVALVRLMGDRAFDILDAFIQSRTHAPKARHGNIALLPLTLDTNDTKDQLIEAARRERRLVLVTAELADRALGPEASVGDVASARVASWFSKLERGADLLVYECDPQQPRWSALCMRQSDRLVVIADADREPRIDDIQRFAREANGYGLTRAVELVLVHHPMTTLPSGTRAWSALRELRTVHHVRRGNTADIERVVRRLVGQPTGLVLSGGGARGIAHVGVIAAIREAGIPIDYICGTSMGALFAASLALGFDVPRIRAEVRELFAKPFALYDVTLPVSSLLAGKKLDRVLQHQFGDADIEDLWLPFFCVSTDLSRARLVVHDRGCLWQSVRASCSIPGIFPPLAMGGRILVDGGLVNNLPLDLLLERCAGPIIAVDVFPYGDPGFETPNGPLARWLRSVRTRLRGAPASPPLFDILVRSTLVGSKYRQQDVLTRGDQVVYLEPPVASFGVLQWRAHRALFDAGYRYAQRQLSQHSALLGRRAA